MTNIPRTNIGLIRESIREEAARQYKRNPSKRKSPSSSFSKTKASSIHVDQLISRITEELERKKTVSDSNKGLSIEEIVIAVQDEINKYDYVKTFQSSPTDATNKKGIHHQDEPLPGCPGIKMLNFSSGSEFNWKDGNNVSELLKFHDSEFIEIVYRTILNRLPDPDGKSFFLSKLRSGELTKIEIIGRLRYSPEGRIKKVRAPGLFVPFAIQSSFRIPVFGYASRILVGIFNLPAILRNFQNLENTIFVHRNENRQRSQSIIDELSILSNHVEDIQDKITESLKNKSSRADLEKLVNNMNSCTNKIEDLNSQLTSIKETFNLDLDISAIYSAFEDKFRGTREDIRSRQKVYLPYLEKVITNIEDDKILDLGCGRGEWLELIKDQGFFAKGVDVNKEMISRCKKINLDVIESSAMDYLMEVPSNSLTAVTGFHIIEHLSLKEIITLFEQCFKALRSGGIAIFETPNPENLIVGAYKFYTDPTHKQPLVPETIKFFFEQSGFQSVEIKRLHKYSEFYQVEPRDKFRDEWFYNEMDYAVIGVKE